MTPFDGTALLAMLLAFYPIASPAALVRARAERPAYFAGALLIGHSGDKIQLPDARIFDVIYAVDDPLHRHWQMLEALPGGAGIDDPYALVDGPLAPLDEPDVPPSPAIGSFEGLVADALDELGASDSVLQSARDAIITAAPAEQLDNATGLMLDDAEAGHVEYLEAVGRVDAADEVAGADGLTAGLDDQARDYHEPASEDVPEYDPGPSPRDDGTEPPPPAPA